MFLKCCTWDAVWTPPTIIVVQVGYCGAAILLKVQELTSLWSSIPSNGSSSSSLTTTGMQPLKIASNSRAEDGVSPAGLRQKTDLSSHNTNISTSNRMDIFLWAEAWSLPPFQTTNFGSQIQWIDTNHEGGLNWPFEQTMDSKYCSISGFVHRSYLLIPYCAAALPFLPLDPSWITTSSPSSCNTKASLLRIFPACSKVFACKLNFACPYRTIELQNIRLLFS